MTDFIDDFDIAVIALLYRSKAIGGETKSLPGVESLANALRDRVIELFKGDGSRVGEVAIVSFGDLKPVQVPSPSDNSKPLPIVETAPWWATLKTGSIVVNQTSKALIDMYDMPRGTITGHLAVDWEMKLVAEPQLDRQDKNLGWLMVNDKPIGGKAMYWVQSTTVKPKQ